MGIRHISGLSGNVVASGIDAEQQFAIAGTNHKVNAQSLRWLAARLRRGPCQTMERLHCRPDRCREGGDN